MLFRKETIEGWAENIRESTTTEDKEAILLSLRSYSFHFINGASKKPPTKPDSPAQHIEAVREGVSVLWHMFIETAKVFDHDDAFQEKLIQSLLWTKEYDALRRAFHRDETDELDWDAYGFAESLQAAWEPLLTGDDPVEQKQDRLNLAAFSAKLMSVGVCGDLIVSTALWYLRQTLEMDHDEERTISLLPASMAWVDHTRHKPLALSITSSEPPQEEGEIPALAAPGSLAQNNGVADPGFSLQRWLFWRRRFQELSHSANPEVAKKAKEGFMRMVHCGYDMEYDVPGEARFMERLQTAMGEELIRSGKESVEGDDINIKVDWID